MKKHYLSMRIFTVMPVGLLALTISSKAMAIQGTPFPTLFDSVVDHERQSSGSNEIALRRVPDANSSIRYKGNSVVATVSEYLYKNGMNPQIAVAPVFEGREFVDLGFFFSGVKLCHPPIRYVKSNISEGLIVGSFPEVKYQSTDSRDQIWPSLNSIRAQILTDVSKEIGSELVITETSEGDNCFALKYGDLHPAKKFLVAAQSVSYQLIASDTEVFQVLANQLDLVKARIQAFVPNKNANLDYYAVDVNGDGTLTNDRFRTEVYRSAQRVRSPQLQFNFSGFNAADAEGHAFLYANQHWDYLTNHGFKPKDKLQIVLQVRSIIDGDGGNAGYLPGGPRNAPYIVIGQGDSRRLQNLEFDRDVVAHEVGHHAVFGSINEFERNSESHVLHEGIADFFAMSARNDSCLAPTVCREGSKANSCIINENRCLRSADNEIRFMDETYTSDAFSSDSHLRSFLISGLLWDFVTKGGIPLEVVTRYVLRTLNYVPSNANYKNFISALLYTDQLEGSIHSQTIQQVSMNRGFDMASLGINLADLPTSIGTSPEKAVSVPHFSASLTRHMKSGCAVLGATSPMFYSVASISASKMIGILLAFLSPLVFIVRPRRKL
ncbi:MAG: hypothetical protein NT027_10430 [Proteobacteria bacterium]|nr:hypothetical protein [Pseudomonadota bacterium]